MIDSKDGDVPLKGGKGDTPVLNKGGMPKKSNGQKNYVPRYDIHCCGNKI